MTGYEMELKYELSTADRQLVTDLLVSCGLEVIRTESASLVSRYIDTKERSLAEMGIGLRARGHQGNEVDAIWTLKAKTTNRGARFSSVELQWEGKWCVLPDPVAHAVLSCLGNVELIEIARIFNKREAIAATGRTGKCEIALDTVEVEFPKRSSFVELEVESEDEPLLELCQDFLDGIGLTRSSTNKLGRATGEMVSEVRDSESFIGCLDFDGRAFVAAPWCKEALP
jgi:inorganic triphosphatase YgiF